MKYLLHFDWSTAQKNGAVDCTNVFPIMDNNLSISIPFKNLTATEVEIMKFEQEANRLIESDNSNLFPNGNAASNIFSSSPSQGPPVKNCSLITLILSCTVAASVQFGWALQLSLLTPYIQTLGIEHAFSSFIWLCGPITGLVVQPCVGIWSDKCSSKYGRRRPFILLGSLMISVAVIIIGFSADIGYLIGDREEHCRTYKGTRTRAAFVFILGFWMLDLANNTVQKSPDQRNSANAIFCSWMAIGNILGFSSGSSGKWHSWFPFLTSRACCEACGNLKAAFLVAVIFLTFCTMVTLYFAKEVPLAPKQHLRLSDVAPLLEESQDQQRGPNQSESKPRKTAVDHKVGNMPESVFELDTSKWNADSAAKEDQVESFSDSPGAVLVNLLTSLRHLPMGMHSVLIVMALTWLSWFPFFLFDTDWMGREVYHGDPKGTAFEIIAYNAGVREGAFGLLLNSVVLGISSFLIEPMCRWIGSKFVWAISNFIVFACMAAAAIITLVSLEEARGSDNAAGGNEAIKTASLVVFAIMCLPLAVSMTISDWKNKLLKKLEGVTMQQEETRQSRQLPWLFLPFWAFLWLSCLSCRLGKVISRLDIWVFPMFRLVYLRVIVSVPFSVTADLTADTGGGQVLAIGVLNLAIVIPQMIVSLGAGPWDALFGGGNVPAFVLASLSALAACIFATLKLPTPSNSYKPIGFHIG